MAIKKLTTGFLNLLILAVSCFVFILPLLRLVGMSLLTDGTVGLGNYSELLSQKRTISAIVNTVIIAVSSSAVSVIFGSFLAFLEAYTDIRHKRLLELLVLSPFVIPSYIITLSWSSLLSSRGVINTFLSSHFGFKADIYSIGGIILVLGICNTAVVYLNVLPMLRKIPRDMEWAAQVSGYNIWQAMRKINIVQAMPAIASGGMLSFLAAIDNFSVPAFLGIPAGIPVLSTYIYENVIGFGPSAFSTAAALSVMLSAIAISGTVIQGLMVRKSSAMESIKEEKEIRVYLGRYKNPVEYGVILFLITLNIFPLISMILSCFFPPYGAKTLDKFTLENFQFVFTNSGVKLAFKNSIKMALITCAVCILIGTAIAYGKVRKGSKAFRAIEQFASLNYAIPGIVLALAMIFHWAKLPNVYGTMRILIIAYITRYLILQIKSSSNALLAIDVSLEEAAQVSGGGMLRRWLRIIIPLTLRPVLSGSFLIFMQSVTELTLSSMLAAAGSKTIGLTIFSLQQGGDYNRSAAVSSVVVAMVALAYLIIALTEHIIYVKNRKRHDTEETEDNSDGYQY